MKLTRRGAAKVGIFLTSALAAILLAFVPTALGATGLTASSSASAHTGTVVVSQNCLPDGTRSVTYTGSTSNVPASGNGHTATLTVGEILPVGTTVTPAVQTVVGNASYTWTHIVPGTAKSAQSTAFLVWGDGAKQDPIGKITFTSDCAPVIAPPTQTVKCDVISADYHRPLSNGDHLNVDISVRVDGKVTKLGQVNMQVDQNVDGGASYNGQNKLGLKWIILGVEQKLDPIPLTLDEVMKGVLKFNYAPKLTEALTKLGYSSWIIPFVQSSETDTWPNLECGDVVVHSNPSRSVIAECGFVQMTFNNVIVLKKGEVGENAVFTYTDEKGATQTVSVPPNTIVVKTVTFEIGTGNHSVSVGVKGQQQTTYTVTTYCMSTPPTTPTPTPTPTPKPTATPTPTPTPSPTATPRPTPSSTPPATVVPPTPTATAIAKTAASTKMLPSTGFDATGWLIAAGIMLLVGFAAIGARATFNKRRKTNE